VVLPSGPLAPCVLAVIDRLYTDVLTFLDLCANDAGGAVLGQLAVGRNPRDLLALDDGRALVSRFDVGLRPDTPELERGNDLLVIDWVEPRVVRRIDLSGLDSREGEHTLARPDRMTRLRRGGADVVVVGLARLSSDFWVAGPGAVAFLDVERLEPRALPLEGLANCGEVDAVPGHPELAVVTCAGLFEAPEEERREQAGLAMVELAADGTLSVKARWSAADHPDAPVFNAHAVPLSAERVVVTATGDPRRGINDRVGVVELGGSGSYRLLFEAGAAFVVGDGTFDAEAGLLLLPDGDAATARPFVIGADADASPSAPVHTARCRGLPPREIRSVSRE
jgi:hypothetical protein